MQKSWNEVIVTTSLIRAAENYRQPDMMVAKQEMLMVIDFPIATLQHIQNSSETTSCHVRQLVLSAVAAAIPQDVCVYRIKKEYLT